MLTQAFLLSLGDLFLFGASEPLSACSTRPPWFLSNGSQAWRTSRSCNRQHSAAQTAGPCTCPATTARDCSPHHGLVRDIGSTAVVGTVVLELSCVDAGRAGQYKNHTTRGQCARAWSPRVYPAPRAAAPQCLRPSVPVRNDDVAVVNAKYTARNNQIIADANKRSARITWTPVSYRTMKTFGSFD